jgi:hypothetical protein
MVRDPSDLNARVSGQGGEVGQCRVPVVEPKNSYTTSGRVHRASFLTKKCALRPLIDHSRKSGRDNQDEATIKDLLRRGGRVEDCQQAGQDGQDQSTSVA